MLNFITNNVSSIFVGTVILILVLFVTSKMIKAKKSGKSSCGCNCADCPSKGMCHPK